MECHRTVAIIFVIDANPNDKAYQRNLNSETLLFSLSRTRLKKESKDKERAFIRVAQGSVP
jgi:hypothetical protein